LLKTPFVRYINNDDRSIYLRLQKTLIESDSPQACELRMIKNNGPEFWVHLQAAKALSEDNEPTYRIVISEITQRKKTEKKLHELSFHDQLTGLYNRHYLEEEMKRIDTERQLPIGIIMADLNGLKLINDTYGHSAGDEMLKITAAFLKEACREEDVITRWGGDEFVLLLPQTSTEVLLDICKRIKNLCSGAVIKSIPLSIALGTACKKTPADNLLEVLKKAEDEMYRQKMIESKSTKSAELKALINTLAEKSYETNAHTRNMQAVAHKIGQKCGLSESELTRLILLITLHDIGKINIPEKLLKKNRPLSDDEWTIIKKHPEIGYRVAIATEDFAHIAEDILAHHEWWNGKGYPRGLENSKIPLLARIITIVDAYEIMKNGRPYKPPMTEEEIIAELKRCSGTQFDPELVDILLSILAEGQ